MRLDAWIYPETADQRQALADAAAALGKAERVETVSRTLSRTAERGCGSPVALLLPADAAAADLNAPDGKVAPLARASAIVHVLEAGGRSLRVHRNDKRLSPQRMRASRKESGLPGSSASIQSATLQSSTAIGLWSTPNMQLETTSRRAYWNASWLGAPGVR